MAPKRIESPRTIGAGCRVSPADSERGRALVGSPRRLEGTFALSEAGLEPAAKARVLGTRRKGVSGFGVAEKLRDSQEVALRLRPPARGRPGAGSYDPRDPTRPSSTSARTPGRRQQRPARPHATEFAEYTLVAGRDPTQHKGRAAAGAAALSGSEQWQARAQASESSSAACSNSCSISVSSASPTSTIGPLKRLRAQAK